MSEMVERVARAIAAANRANDWDKIDENDVCDRGYLLRRDYLALARAAIEAMREPTEQMIEAGDEIEIAVGEDNRSIFCGERVWLAMHKLALCGAGARRQRQMTAGGQP